MSSCKQDVSSWGPQQYELKFFWPLTEQPALDLDFKPSIDYQALKHKNSLIGITTGAVLSYNGTCATWAAPNYTPTFQIDIDNNNLNIVSKHKPNIIRRYLYKALGINWKTK